MNRNTYFSLSLSHIKDHEVKSIDAIGMKDDFHHKSGKAEESESSSCNDNVLMTKVHDRCLSSKGIKSVIIMWCPISKSP